VAGPDQVSSATWKNIGQINDEVLLFLLGQLLKFLIHTSTERKVNNTPT